MFNKFKPNFSKIDSVIKSFTQPTDRPMPRTIDNLKRVYARSTQKLLSGGRNLILKNTHVRFISFRDFALNDTQARVEGVPHVVNVKVDPDLNPYVLKVVDGMLIGVVDSGIVVSAKTGWLSIDEFLEYVKAGVFVFVDFNQ